jgi:exodeoxyribonuclease V alpha subunit
MMPTLDLLRHHGLLSPLDDHFARTLGRIAGESRPEVLLAAALAANRVREAHVCLDLAALGNTAPRAEDGGDALTEYAFPEAGTWAAAVAASPLTCTTAGASPLVVEGTRVYLRRYHLHETELASRLVDRAGARSDDVNADVLRAGLRRLFPAASDTPDWQRVGAALALLRRFTIIAGGPGTGKTWTVTRILALLVEQALSRGQRVPRVLLLAPTGKAAARLRESVRESRGSLDVSAAARAAIADESATIHRALGATPDGAFRHGPERPLATDAVIVDEASMVDLALMNRLLSAVPAAARVVLLGDRDQLASVEAGSVLTDICGGTEAERSTCLSAPVAAEVRALAGDDVPTRDDGPPLADSIVYLRESRRFRDHPGIGALAGAIQEANTEAALAVLRADGFPGVVLVESASALARQVSLLASDRYAACLEASTPEQRLEAFGRFRVLCAHRRGLDGAEAMNQAIERALATSERVRLEEPYYVGRLLLVTENDPSTRLFNGDVGLVVRDASGAKAALFGAGDTGAPASDGRLVALSRLPRAETAFAMTVHKSQGSEFDEVVLVLPQKPSPVLTRELFYTAVTRARERVTIVATPDVVAHAIATPTRRDSGLCARLWPVTGSRRSAMSERSR